MPLVQAGLQFRFKEGAFVLLLTNTANLDLLKVPPPRLTPLCLFCNMFVKRSHNRKRWER